MGASQGLKRFNRVDFRPGSVKGASSSPLKNPKYLKNLLLGGCACFTSSRLSVQSFFYSYTHKKRISLFARLHVINYFLHHFIPVFSASRWSEKHLQENNLEQIHPFLKKIELFWNLILLKLPEGRNVKWKMKGVGMEEQGHPKLRVREHWEQGRGNLENNTEVLIYFIFPHPKWDLVFSPTNYFNEGSTPFFFFFLKAGISAFPPCKGK